MYFSDPRIGDFSITFTQVNGEHAEGLTNPILQLEYLDNWTEIGVADLASNARTCKDTSRYCNGDPYACIWG